MRQSVLVMTAAAAGFAALISTGAIAMSGGPSSLRTAIATIDPIETAGCWRFGRHGWGWYEWCGPRHEVWHEVWEPDCREITIRERRFGETEVRHIRRCD